MEDVQESYAQVAIRPEHVAAARNHKPIAERQGRTASRESEPVPVDVAWDQGLYPVARLGTTITRDELGGQCPPYFAR